MKSLRIEAPLQTSALSISQARRASLMWPAVTHTAPQALHKVTSVFPFGCKKVRDSQRINIAYVALTALLEVLKHSREQGSVVLRIKCTG